MKKIFFLALLFCAIIAGSYAGLAWSKKDASRVKVDRPLPLVTQPSSPMESQVAISKPETLLIPSINVTAHIEEVGLDSQNRMDVPKNVFNVGWYKFGARPGDRGSAIIDGHFDTPEGKPSVFYKLKDLQKGDSITVKTQDNQSYTFTVYEVTNYAFDKVPMAEYIQPTSSKIIHLITCGGVWDKDVKNYKERTVVSAKIME